jgi:hypothetical protein
MEVWLFENGRYSWNIVDVINSEFAVQDVGYSVGGASGGEVNF